jgi:hypothetical protein
MKQVQKRNLFLEELSKSVRRKRIGDSEWQTYAEAGREPTINEKCFYLEPATRKWMRARINSFDKEKQLWRVRLMDTGHLEHVTSTDSLLSWRDDIELARLPPRSIKALLHKHASASRTASSHSDLVPDSVEPQIERNDYERNICVQTRFFFKDITHNKQLRCALIDKLELRLEDNNNNNNERSLIGNNCEEDSTWTIRLYLDETNESKRLKSTDSNNSNSNKYSVCLNDDIIEFNTKENMLLKNGPNSTFKSSDIRLEYANQAQYDDSLNPKPKSSIEIEHKKEVANSNCFKLFKLNHASKSITTTSGINKLDDAKIKMVVQVRPNGFKYELPMKLKLMQPVIDFT